MSELKVYVPQDGPYGLEPEEGGKLVEEETCYLKSDVDAVIAEKDKALEFAKALTLKDIEIIKEKDNEIAELKAKLESVQASTYVDSVDAGMRERKLKRALCFARAMNAKNSYLKWNLFANFESKEKLFTIDECDETPGTTDGQVLRTYTEWMRIWQKVERKCREKAEQYK